MESYIIASLDHCLEEKKNYKILDFLKNGGIFFTTELRYDPFSKSIQSQVIAIDTATAAA